MSVRCCCVSGVEPIQGFPVIELINKIKVWSSNRSDGFLCGSSSASSGDAPAGTLVPNHHRFPRAPDVPDVAVIHAD